jgi:hypothetical protein
MNDPLEHDELEPLVERALRDLPQRRAPRRLQSRILDELHSRSAGPWWRRKFAHWPLPARRALIAVCALLTGVSLVDGPWAVAASAGRLAFVRDMQPWLDIGLGAGALLYMTLFGLGAAAYRTLYLQPSIGR